MLAVLAGEGLEGAVAVRVLAYGGDAVFSRGPGLVAFRGEDSLAVSGYEAEAEFAVLAGEEFEPDHEGREEVPIGGDLIRSIK